MSQGLPAGRLVGVLLAVAAITFLAVRIGGELLGDDGAGGAHAIAEDEPEVITGVVEDPEDPEALLEPLPPSRDQDIANAQAIARAKAHERSKGQAGGDGAAEPIGLRLGVNDRVKVTIEVDGAEWFDGYLCPREGPRCDGASPLKVPRAPEIVVALSDLSHARLIYNGRRVEPLGNLDTARRLVFVDDAGQ